MPELGHVPCEPTDPTPKTLFVVRDHVGSVAVNCVSLVQVQAWMGRSHRQTTALYLHHRSQASDAALLTEAFAGQGGGATGVGRYGKLTSWRRL